MLEDLTDDQVAVLTELVIHHGMYRHEQNTPSYDVYHGIAEELIDEFTERVDYGTADVTREPIDESAERGVSKKWVKPIMCEFLEAQFKTVPEFEAK